MLHNLPSAGKDRKRRGRGGSRGGTSGRGGKGQTARSGGTVRIGFEGGQMPLTRRIPKRGFNNAQFQVTIETVNLVDLTRVFESDRTITKQDLATAGLIRKHDNVIKLLGHGAVEKKFVIHVDRVSKSAQEHIIRAGGEVHLTKEK